MHILVAKTHTEIMTIEEAIEVLELHNQWRKGAEIPMESPVRIGMAIDLVVYLAKDAVAAKQPISQIKNKMTEEQIKELG